MSENGGQQNSADDGATDGAPPQQQQPLAPIFDLRSSGSGRGSGSGGSGGSSSSPRTTANPIDFAEDVPSAVQTAINNYTPKDGYFRAKVHQHGRTTSVIHHWGVRLETVAEEAWPMDNKGRPLERPQLFMCMANDHCRNVSKTIKISNKQTSSATNHLAKTHHIKSGTTKTAEAK